MEISKWLENYEYNISFLAFPSFLNGMLEVLEPQPITILQTFKVVQVSQTARVL